MYIVVIKNYLDRVNLIVLSYNPISIGKVSNAHLRILEELKSVPGIGQVSATTLVASLPELGQLSEKQMKLLCYLFLAIALEGKITLII